MARAAWWIFKKTPDRFPLSSAPLIHIYASSPVVLNNRDTAWGEYHIHRIVWNKFLGLLPSAANALSIYKFKQNRGRGILSQDLDLSGLTALFWLGVWFKWIWQSGQKAVWDGNPICYSLWQVFCLLLCIENENVAIIFQIHKNCTWNPHWETVAATVTHNDAVFLWKQKPARKTPCTGLFPYRICRNVKRGAFVQTKMATNNWNKKLFSAEWEQWQEVLAVAQRVRGGRRTATHSPRAAGSHFLPGAPPEWPVVTPEGLGEEVTIGHFDLVGNKVIRLWSRNSLLMASFQHMSLITGHMEL